MFKPCFTYQLLANWRCLFTRQSQILPIIGAWSVLGLAWNCHISSFARAKWQLAFDERSFWALSTTRSDVDIEIFVNTSAAERSSPRVLPTSLETTWWQDNGVEWALPYESDPHQDGARVCLCVYDVCVFAFLLFPGLCPQACDLLAHAWFIHFKSFNLMGYILSKHCLINCGLCTLFLIQPIVLPGGHQNKHTNRRACAKRDYRNECTLCSEVRCWPKDD